MNKRELEITDAPIKYLLRFYLPLMIAFLNKEQVEPWFYSSYIQTKVKRKGYNSWVVYQNFNPFICRMPNPMMTSFFMNQRFFLFMVENMIKFNWYTLINVDLFYLKGSNCNNKRHYNHAVIICGLNKSLKTLKLCGYCFGPKISCVDVTIEEFYKAFKKHCNT